jgi:phosphohistidine phosphatase SixA
MKRRAVLLLPLVAAIVPLAAGADEAALWALLRAGGQVVLVRHAVTDPGVGDPPGFRLEDCGSQRNLSEPGRREAQRLGEILRQRQVPVAQVLTSPWCRCRDTARIAFGRDAMPEPALGNLFGRSGQEAQQVAALRKLVRAPARGNLFMVTHGSTVYALTGVSPGTVEMVVLAPQPGGDFRVAGRIAPD